MRGIRLIAILWLTCVVSGQETSTPEIGRSNTPLPKLPFVDHNACPGKDQIVPKVKISQADHMYPSGLGNEKPIGSLKKGEEVTVLGGVNVVLEPDEAVIKYVNPHDASSLKVGDAALGYGIEADGNLVFWSQGVWFSEWIEAVAEKGQCGFSGGYGPGGCTINITKDGKSEWWVHVKTSHGLSGWVLAQRLNGGKRWYGNFADLCHYGED